MGQSFASIAAELVRPHYQLILFVLLTVIAFVIPPPRQTDGLWTRAGVIYVGFIILNSILVYGHVAPWRYFFFSIAVSIGYLIIISVVVNAAITLLKTQGSGESGMIFLVIIYHPVALLAVMLLQ